MSDPNDPQQPRQIGQHSGGGVPAKGGGSNLPARRAGMPATTGGAGSNVPAVQSGGSNVPVVYQPPVTGGPTPPPPPPPAAAAMGPAGGVTPTPPAGRKSCLPLAAAAAGLAALAAVGASYLPSLFSPTAASCPSDGVRRDARDCAALFNTMATDQADELRAQVRRTYSMSDVTERREGRMSVNRQSRDGNFSVLPINTPNHSYELTVRFSRLNGSCFENVQAVDRPRTNGVTAPQSQATTYTVDRICFDNFVRRR